MCRPPISVQHEPATSSAAIPPRVTEHTRIQHAEHLAANGMDGFDQSWQPKRPIKYLRKLAVQERTRALTEDGLYSQKVKWINAKDVAMKEAELRRGSSKAPAMQEAR